jgi:hypothetical protein
MGIVTGIALKGRWRLGDRLRKKSGSSWQGRVVGFYSTDLTPVGYCVESEREPGSVQIYAETALELVPTPSTTSDGGKDG